MIEPLKNGGQTEIIPLNQKRIMNYRLLQIEGIPF